jgi:hypothetical protein
VEVLLELVVVVLVVVLLRGGGVGLLTELLHTLQG